MPEGVEHRKLYQIFQGKCSVEKEVEGSANREIVNLLKVYNFDGLFILSFFNFAIQENDLYGEIAFVLNNYSQTSLVAQTDVEMYPNITRHTYLAALLMFI